MQLLYAVEHLSCLNYEGSERPLIELKKVSQNEIWETQTLENKIVCVVDGVMRFSFADSVDSIATKGQFVALAGGFRFKCFAVESLSLVIFRLNEKAQLCDNFMLKQLLQINENQTGNPKVYETPEVPHRLDMNQVFWNYINLLFDCMNSGLRCKHYLEGKLKELFFILRAYYPKEELNLFFQALLSTDISFSNYVLQNHHKYKTLTELAESMNYSLSGFEKRFKKVFGMYGYRWMKEQKAKRIFHQISNTDSNFKEIASEFGFCSQSYFNDFCKAQFGKTPGEIRKNK